MHSVLNSAYVTIHTRLITVLPSVRMQIHVHIQVIIRLHQLGNNREYCMYGHIYPHPPHSDGDDYSVTVEREVGVLYGVMEHLLPRVGPHVRTLDLANGKAVSNEAVGPIFPYYKRLACV